MEHTEKSDKGSGSTALDCYNSFPLKLLKWVKKKLGIRYLERELHFLRDQLSLHHDFVSSKVDELKDYTRVDADVGIRGNNTIVLTGVYRSKAYVQFFDVGDGEFRQLVEQLRSMKDHALIRHIDSPPAFKGVFKL